MDIIFVQKKERGKWKVNLGKNDSEIRSKLSVVMAFLPAGHYVESIEVYTKLYGFLE